MNQSKMRIGKGRAVAFLIMVMIAAKGISQAQNVAGYIVASTVDAVINNNKSARNSKPLSFAMGCDLATGLSSESAGLGVAPRILFDLNRRVRLEGVLTYFPSLNKDAVTDISFNAHYMIDNDWELQLYPIAGFGFLSREGRTDGGYTPHFNATAGCGIEYPLFGRFSVNGELKYKATKNSISLGMFTAGIICHF